jgi:hypothetical protein
VKTPDGLVKFGPIDTTLPANFWLNEHIGEYLPNPKPPKAKTVSKKAQKRASVRQEVEVMEALGGRRQTGSGAVGHLKGDGRVRGKWRVEMKYTRKDSYRVERKELGKIRGECEGLEKPLFVIDFQNGQTGNLEDRWVLVPYEDFLKLDKNTP